jgi:hypothetical protein
MQRQSKKVKKVRPVSARLSFEVGAPGKGYSFRSLTRMLGVDVGLAGDAFFRAPISGPILDLCLREDFLRADVLSVMDWCEKLGVDLRGFHLGLVFQTGSGCGISGAKAITGRDGQAVLLIESEVIDGRLGVDLIDSDPDDVDTDLCEDIFPHELTHFLDVRQGRSASGYPWLLRDQGECLDLFRHFWIDGHLKKQCCKAEGTATEEQSPVDRS